jgi:hypothetical protein
MPTSVPKNSAGPGTSGSSFQDNPLRQVRYLYTTFIQGLFSFRPPGSYHWTEDMKRTEVVVTDESPLHIEVLGGRPGITFTRAPVGAFHLGFDDMILYDPTTGRKTKSMLNAGTMVINCCSRVDLESEHLAWVCYEYIWLLRDLLMKAGFYDVGRGMQVGSPTPAGKIVEGDAGDEYYCTTVTSPYHFQRTSEFTPLNAIMLKELAVRLSTNPLALVASGQNIASSPNGDLPYQVNDTPPAPFAPGAPTGTPGLDLVPHPMDPSRLVSVRVIRGNQGGFRTFAPSGASLPIPAPTVEESVVSKVVKTTVKV